jgi:uncharacterized membrane protein YhiD involved in acid resistance
LVLGVLAGSGYAAYAAVATGFILFVNLLLRPIVAFINRQPLMSTEIEIAYLVSVTCRGLNCPIKTTRPGSKPSSELLKEVTSIPKAAPSGWVPADQ